VTVPYPFIAKQWSIMNKKSFFALDAILFNFTFSANDLTNNSIPYSFIALTGTINTFPPNFVLLKNFLNYSIFLSN
jgi:hypothetical protein